MLYDAEKRRELEEQLLAERAAQEAASRPAPPAPVPQAVDTERAPMPRSAPMAAPRQAPTAPQGPRPYSPGFLDYLGSFVSNGVTGIMDTSREARKSQSDIAANDQKVKQWVREQTETERHNKASELRGPPDPLAREKFEWEKSQAAAKAGDKSLTPEQQLAREKFEWEKSRRGKGGSGTKIDWAGENEALEEHYKDKGGAPVAMRRRLAAIANAPGKSQSVQLQALWEDARAEQNKPAPSAPYDPGAAGIKKDRYDKRQKLQEELDFLERTAAKLKNKGADEPLPGNEWFGQRLVDSAQAAVSGGTGYDKDESELAADLKLLGSGTFKSVTGQAANAEGERKDAAAIAFGSGDVGAAQSRIDGEIAARKKTLERLAAEEASSGQQPSAPIAQPQRRIKGNDGKTYTEVAPGKWEVSD